MRKQNERSDGDRKNKKTDEAAGNRISTGG